MGRDDDSQTEWPYRSRKRNPHARPYRRKEASPKPRPEPSILDAYLKPHKAEQERQQSDERRSTRPTQDGQGSGVKNRIKEIVCADPRITVDDLMEKLGREHGKLSRMTVAGIRGEFRHTLRFLQANGIDALTLRL